MPPEHMSNATIEGLTAGTHSATGMVTKRHASTIRLQLITCRFLFAVVDTFSPRNY